MSILKFYKSEFEDLKKEILKQGKFNNTIILKVKNFKAQAPLITNSWDEIENTVNLSIEKLENNYLSESKINELFISVCKIKGIGVPTASVFLATKYPDYYAIIDSNIYSFFISENAYSETKIIFNITDENDELKQKLKELKTILKDNVSTKKNKPNFEKGIKENTIGEVYFKYISILDIIRKLTKSELREIEWKIFEKVKGF